MDFQFEKNADHLTLTSIDRSLLKLVDIDVKLLLNDLQNPNASTDSVPRMAKALRSHCQDLLDSQTLK